MNNSLKNKFQVLYPYLIITLLAFVTIIPQWHAQAAFIGIDSLFHMNRFYDAMMQIKTGNYNYFPTFFGFNQSGRIVNAVYGPAFAYVNGAILLIAKNWVNYQIITTFLILFLSGILMYHLCIANNVKKILGMLIAVTYMFSMPILYWINGQRFTAWGAAFFPLIMLMGTNMMREHKIHWIKLALAMTLMLQVHNVTTAICVITLIPFFMVGLMLSSNKKKMILDLLKAIALTLILAANVWGGLLEVSLSNNLLPTVPEYPIASSSIHLLGGGTRVPHSTLILFIIVLLYLLFRWKHISIYVKTISLTGFFVFWISTHYFPWATLEHYFPLIDSVLQDPVRLFVVPCVLLLLSVGICLSDESIKWSRYIAIGLSVLVVILLVRKDLQNVDYKISVFNGPKVINKTNLYYVTNKNPKHLRNALRSSNTKKILSLVYKPTPDYVPLKHKMIITDYHKLGPYGEYKRQIIERTEHPTNTVKDGEMLVRLNNRTDHTKTIKTSIFKYAHTSLTLNGKPLKNFVTSDIGVLKIPIKPGISTLKVSYHPAMWFLVLMGISILAWLILIILGIIRLF